MTLCYYLFEMELAIVLITLLCLICVPHFTLCVTEIIREHKTEKQCLWSEGISEPYVNTPEATVTLNCSNHPDSVMYVLTADYVRAPHLGDLHCLRDATNSQCCRMRMLNRSCVVPFSSVSYGEVEESCNGRTACSVEVQAVQLEGCVNKCLTASDATLGDENLWCWARFVNIHYICIQKYSSSDTLWIGLAVAVPVSFIAGGLIVFLILKYCNTRHHTDKPAENTNSSNQITRQASESNQYVDVRESDADRSKYEDLGVHGTAGYYESIKLNNNGTRINPGPSRAGHPPTVQDISSGLYESYACTGSGSGCEDDAMQNTTKSKGLTARLPELFRKRRWKKPPTDGTAHQNRGNHQSNKDDTPANYESVKENEELTHNTPRGGAEVQSDDHTYLGLIASQSSSTDEQRTMQAASAIVDTK